MSIFAEKRRGKLTGRWVAEIERQGKRTRVILPTYEEARLADSQLLAGFSVATVHAKGNLTLGWLLEQSALIWRDCKDDQQPKRFRMCVGLLGAATPIANVDTTALDILQERLMDLRPKRRCERPIRDPKTVHRYLSSISAALRWAYKRKHIAAMPAIPWPKVTETPKRFFTLEDEQAVCRDLLEHGHIDHALVVRILSQTGLRAGELFRLRPDSIANGFVLVGDWQGGTKNGETRYVPISEPMAVALRSLLERGLPTYRSLWRCLKASCGRAGVDPRKTLHKLRHTTATRLVKGGVPLPVIQRYLGHKDIKTTMGYVSIESHDLTQASEALRCVGGVERNRELEASIVSQGADSQSPEITNEIWR